MMPMFYTVIYPASASLVTDVFILTMLTDILKKIPRRIFFLFEFLSSMELQ